MAYEDAKSVNNKAEADNLYKQAFEYYQKAAYQTNELAVQMHAFITLGECYYFGEGVDADISLAKSYFEQAYQQTKDLNSKVMAGVYLGRICYEIEENDAMAMKYFRSVEYDLQYTIRSERTSDMNWAKARACFYLGLLTYSYADAPGKELFEICGDYEHARNYFLCVANQDYDMTWHAKANLYLGEMYYCGLAHKLTDGLGARYYFERAASQNDDTWAKSRACCYLGKIYYDGTNVDRDFIKARHYFEDTLGSGVESDPISCAYAQLHLGYIYYSGAGIAKDKKVALDYFERAANQDVDYATKNEARAVLGKGYSKKPNPCTRSMRNSGLTRA